MMRSSPSAATAAADGASELEVRPGGMLVQKRDPRAEPPVAPTIRVKVKHGATHHQIYLSSQATFGELKKRMSELTGLHPQDQKVVFKAKERDSNAYLDISGVKDGSKMAVLEDATAQAKRLLESRRQATAEMAAKSISSIGLEVDRLAQKVSALEVIVSKGGKVVESEVMNLIELLMTQLIKLDGIVVDGNIKLQRGMQVRRVQKFVETLDLIKIKIKSSMQTQQQQPKPPVVVVTTNWETFDSLFSPAPSATTSASTSAASSASPTPRFDWELF